MRVKYTELDPSYPTDVTAYNKGDRWCADTTHPTVPTVIGIRHIIGETGKTKAEAREKLEVRVKKIIEENEND